MAFSDLDSQYPTFSTPSTKIRLAILATAMVDALGGPPEFHKRFSFPLVTSMLPNTNFSLPPGIWTDDTSMVLCLARSLATYMPKTLAGQPLAPRGGFDEKHQLDRYNAWYTKGVLSAIGRCFDIGSTIRYALHIYATHPSTYQRSTRNVGEALREIEMKLSAEECAGNGSLMRVLPIGLAYWRDEGLAREYARRSSRTTHPNLICQEACEVWTGAIVRIMHVTIPGEKKYTKLDLVKYFVDFPYTCNELRDVLALPPGVPPRPVTKDALKDYYLKHHPILHLIYKTQAKAAAQGNDFYKWIPPARLLPSSGYVVHTIVAALYCFFATTTFEEGAILAVNLGDDADTVGSVYAGLAGCWYGGIEGQEGSSLFWSKRVKDWRDKLVARTLVEEVADQLSAFSERSQ